jgi:hypothetical protein
MSNQEEVSEKGLVISGPEATYVTHLLMLLKGLELEERFPDMKLTRGPTCSARIKKEFGFKGNKQKLKEQMVKLINEKRKLIPEGAVFEGSFTDALTK